MYVIPQLAHEHKEYFCYNYPCQHHGTVKTPVMLESCQTNSLQKLPFNKKHLISVVIFTPSDIFISLIL